MESFKHAHSQTSKQAEDALNIGDELEPVMQAILEVCRVVADIVEEAQVETCKQAEAGKGVSKQFWCRDEPPQPQALMMVAAVATRDDFDAPSFDFGIDIQPKSTAKLYDLDDFPNTDSPLILAAQCECQCKNRTRSRKI